MTSSNVYLIQMADSSVACGDCDVFELYVHVIFRCATLYQQTSRCSLHQVDYALQSRVLVCEKVEPQHTFKEFTAIDLTGRDLESNDMPLLDAC